MSKSAFIFVQNRWRVIVAEPTAELTASLIFLGLKLKLWRHHDDLGYVLIIQCETFRKFGV